MIETECFACEQWAGPISEAAPNPRDPDDLLCPRCGTRLTLPEEQQDASR